MSRSFGMTSTDATNDNETDSLSLHRLIQSEMRFRMKENERQGAFDTTVRLILSKFPDRGILAPRVDLWEKGAIYLEHVLAIANDWHDSQQRTDPLKPTSDLCNLMTNVAYFVEDNDPVGMLSLCVNVASEAYKKLPEELKDLNLWTDILHTLAFRDLKEGDFKSSKMLGHEILSIYERQGRTDKTTMTNVYNILGLAADSAGQHDEARMWLQKSINAQGDDDSGKEEDIRRLASRNHLNLARNRYLTGDFTEARKQCDLSAAAAETFPRTWNVWAFIHETYASLHRRSGNLVVEARHHVDLAWAALEEARGEAATTSWTAGICAYRAAEVAIAEGDAPRAREWAERARGLNRMYKVPVGTLARSTRLLSRALELDPGRAEEAEEVRREAERLRGLLPAGRTDLGDESDGAFEMLVDIIQR